MAARPEWRRLGVLALACGLGAAMAALGQWLGGSERWWLALPVALALGWWFVGTPQHCLPAAPGRPGTSPEPGPRAPGTR